jgi:hypothetical protein
MVANFEHGEMPKTTNNPRAGQISACDHINTHIYIIYIYTHTYIYINIYIYVYTYTYPYPQVLGRGLAGYIEHCRP